MRTLCFMDVAIAMQKRRAMQWLAEDCYVRAIELEDGSGTCFNVTLYFPPCFATGKGGRTEQMFWREGDQKLQVA